MGSKLSDKSLDQRVHLLSSFRATRRWSGYERLSNGRVALPLQASVTGSMSRSRRKSVFQMDLGAFTIALSTSSRNV